MQEREEDLNIIKDMFKQVVHDKVCAAVDPICKRMEKLEKDHNALQQKVEQLIEQIINLKPESSEIESNQVEEITISYHEL